MNWADRVKQDKPHLKLHEPEERGERDYIGQAEARRIFLEMLESRMPRISPGTDREL